MEKKRKNTNKESYVIKKREGKKQDEKENSSAAQPGFCGTYGLLGKPLRVPWDWLNVSWD